MSPAHRIRTRLVIAFACVVLAAGTTRAADPGDEAWSTAYPPAGIVGRVSAMLPGPGVVYVGGAFNAIGDQPVANVAALTIGADPELSVTAVAPLGTGLNGAVAGVCEHGGDLVAIGGFTASGPQALQHVARWDGAAWQPVGGGLPDTHPQAVASFQGDLYAGDYRWNGVAWENVLQTDSTINALVVADGLLYVGGRFTEAAGQAVSYVFAWDGTQVVPLAEGFPQPVECMVAAPDGVHAYGRDDWWNYPSLRRWDGAAWQVENTTLNIDRLGVYGGDLYAATTVFVSPHNYKYVLQTDAGGTWHEVATVHPDAMLEVQGRLLVQAGTGDAAPLLTAGLAAFDGTDLRDVFAPAGYSAGARSLASFGSATMVGGTYAVLDGQPVAGSAIKSGTTWFPAGSAADIASPYPAYLKQIETVGTYPYAVYAWMDWDIEVDELVRLAWVGDAYHWQPVDNPAWNGGPLQAVGPWLYSLDYGTLWRIDPASGASTSMGPYAADGAVADMCAADGLLTIAGSFTAINGQPTGNVARFTGSGWEGIGGGLPGNQVEAITPTEPGRLAAAVKTSLTVHNVWTWDGGAWTMLPGDFNGTIEHVIQHRGRLFAVGRFVRVGPVWASGVAVWTGDRWAPLGSGLGAGMYYDLVTDVHSDGTSLFFAGNFTRAGGRPAPGLAEWTGDPTLFTGAPSGVPEVPAGARLLEDPQPNPFNPLTRIAFTAPADAPVTVGIYDVRGRCVRTLVDEDLRAGRHVRRWDGRDDAGRGLPSGVYFARMRTDGRTESVKLTLVR